MNGAILQFGLRNWYLEISGLKGSDFEFSFCFVLFLFICVGGARVSEPRASHVQGMYSIAEPLSPACPLIFRN